MNQLLKKLNKYSLKSISHYQNLQIYNKNVNTPYYINKLDRLLKKLLKDSGLSEEQVKKIHETYKNRETSFGWYRGKGTPEQLEQAVSEISIKVDLPLKNATSEGIAEFMKLYGLGVDCSGFVYNVLSYAFKNVNKSDEFNNSLNWRDPKKKDVNYAGAFVFTGKTSVEIKPTELQPLDILLIYNNEEYTHIALFIDHTNELRLAQSNINTIPTGITITKFNTKRNKPIFSFKQTLGNDWSEYFSNGQMEFRRLKIIL